MVCRAGEVSKENCNGIPILSPEQRHRLIMKFTGYRDSMVCGEHHVLPVTFIQDAPNIKSKVK